MRASLLYIAVSLVASAFTSSAHPTNERRDGPTPSPEEAAIAALKLLVAGNSRFTHELGPHFFEESAKSQHPPFAFLGCSDSRVSEGSVFDATPGTLFTYRNIANRYESSDLGTSSFLAYGVTALGVTHVVVLGHYGCGGVQASMLPRPATVDASSGAVQNWIDPIRHLYETSSHPDIVASRSKTYTEAPVYDDPAFRALVEENIKHSAETIYSDPTIVNRYKAVTSGETATAGHKRADPAPIIPVFIHSWVYDLRTGTIKDLKKSFGPDGHKIPMLADYQ